MLHQDADAMITKTIADMLSHGERIDSLKDQSYECLYYQTGLTNVRKRIFANPARPLNIVTAVARFTWLVAGNNRVEDIAYYEPKVRGFSDDQLTVPGSDYGMRLFQPLPGVDQIQGVVDRLKASHASRQASAVVWNPLDAVRDSKDIPCTFGFHFHIRNNELHMAVNMRSNNAFRILPFNVFEFTLLQEMVASEIGVPVGDYHHWAASMHVYQNPREWEPTIAIGHNDSYASYLMPDMPIGDGYQQARELARLEAALRHCHTELDVAEVVEDSLSSLNDYWLMLFGVLQAWGQVKRGWLWDSSGMDDWLVGLIDDAVEGYVNG